MLQSIGSDSSNSTNFPMLDVIDTSIDFVLLLGGTSSTFTHTLTVSNTSSEG